MNASFFVVNIDMILVPGLVRIGKRKELNGSKKVEDIWTSSYCTYLKIKDSDSIVAFGLNNCYQLGAEDMENRYQPDLIQTLKFMAPLKKVIGGMHHTLFLDQNGKLVSHCIIGLKFFYILKLRGFTYLMFLSSASKIK